MKSCEAVHMAGSFVKVLASDWSHEINMYKIIEGPSMKSCEAVHMGGSFVKDLASDWSHKINM